MQNAPTDQAPGLYRRKIGDAVVTALFDGVLHIEYGIVKGVGASEAEKVQTANFRPGPPVISISCFLVHHKGKVSLIDSGAGDNEAFDAGRLPKALNAAGVSPDAIDHVIMTHLHPDHAGGNATKDGRAVFPNATFHVHADEAKFWLETVNPPAEMKPYFDGAKAAAAPYRDRMTTFTKGEVVPGIEAEPLPGHTPGHSGFHITSGKESLLLWADIVHLPALQARHPEAYLTFDIDPEQAKAHRQRLFDKVAFDRLMVAGPHLDFPAFAHLERDGNAYAFVPEVWRPTV